MLLTLVDPNRSICSNSKGISLEIRFLLLKDFFYLFIYLASITELFFLMQYKRFL